MTEQGIRSTRTRRSRAGEAQTEANQGLLHQARTGVQVIGRIRPGIKVLTKKAQNVPGVREAYAEGWRVGASFEDIERRLKQVQGCPDYPLIPYNVPWFRVCREDWRDPSMADVMMKLYAEQREGDKGPRLYEFPIVFTSDDLDTVFEETFEAWTRRELRFWSQVDPGTGYVHCMMKADPSKYAKRGAKQHWGGRPDVVRKLCDPNQCQEFLAGECRHYGTLRFSVPGIEGLGHIELTFQSVYAKLGISEILEQVQSIRGTWTGLHNEQPFFWIGKQRAEVSRVDWESGQVSRQGQDIITLSVRGVDMVQLYAATMQQHPALEGPATDASEPEQEKPVTGYEEPLPNEQTASPSMTEGGTVNHDAGMRDGGVIDNRSPEPEPPDTEPNPQQGRPEPEPGPEKPKRTRRSKDEIEQCKAGWERIEAARKALDWPESDLEQWVFGQPEYQAANMSDLKKDATAMSRIADMIEGLAKNGSGGGGSGGDAGDDGCPFV